VIDTPASKHRRRGKQRPRDKNQEAGGYRLSPELAGELKLLHGFVRTRCGERDPSEDELQEALASLAGRVPAIDRLLHELDHNDPDGTKARLLLAMAGAA
jgi:hypothetical protein